MFWYFGLLLLIFFEKLGIRNWKLKSFQTICVVISTALFTIALLPQPSFSAGLSVNPSRLEADITRGQAHTLNITVSNPTTEVSLIEIYPDNFRSIIEASPRSLTLEAEESKIVAITITPLEVGSFSTLISVVSRPLNDRTFKAGSGIKIPLNFTVSSFSNDSRPWWIVLLVIVDTVLLFFLVLFVIRRMKRKKINK